MTARRPDPDAVWGVFGRHMNALYGPPPGHQFESGPGHFICLSGAPHLELNFAAAYGTATRADIAGIARLLDERALPTVIGVAPHLAPLAGRILTGPEYVRLAQAEPLMWFDGAPPRPEDGPFAIREVGSERDRAAFFDVIAAAKGLDPAALAGNYALAGSTRAWLAWDGDEALSGVVLTTEGSAIGVWEMMTAPGHRRRGAGQAVLTAAMSAAWAPGVEGFFLWSTPLGRPLYASVGYRVLSETGVWTRAATEEELRAVGQA